MIEHLKENEQLIFTTHNTDMLDLNIPKHAFAFLRKKITEGECEEVTVIYASDILKRNTDSVRHAVENDVFSSLPDDSLLDTLESGGPETDCQGFFNQIHKKSTKKVPEAPYGS